MSLYMHFIQLKASCGFFAHNEKSKVRYLAECTVPTVYPALGAARYVGIDMHRSLYAYLCQHI